MKGVRDRRAAFVCAAAMVHEGGDMVIQKRWEGSLAEHPAGSGGFGYDPVFIPQGHTVTAAELQADQKDELSHRGQAFRALAPHILALG
jgi:XTP/dITP diphosphohydrolase